MEKINLLGTSPAPQQQVPQPQIQQPQPQPQVQPQQQVQQNNNFNQSADRAVLELFADAGGSETRIVDKSGDLSCIDSRLGIIDINSPYTPDNEGTINDFIIEYDGEKGRYVKEQMIEEYQDTPLEMESYKHKTEQPAYIANLIHGALSKIDVETAPDTIELKLYLTLPPVEVNAGSVDKSKYNLSKDYIVTLPHINNKKIVFRVTSNNIKVIPEGVAAKYSLTREESAKFINPTLIVDVGARSTDITPNGERGVTMKKHSVTSPIAANMLLNIIKQEAAKRGIYLTTTEVIQAQETNTAQQLDLKELITACSEQFAHAIVKSIKDCVSGMQDVHIRYFHNLMLVGRIFKVRPEIIDIIKLEFPHFNFIDVEDAGLANIKGLFAAVTQK